MNYCVFRGGEEVMMDVGGQDATESFEVYFAPPMLVSCHKPFLIKDLIRHEIYANM